MYYEDPELNDDRQYAQNNLDNNGKNIEITNTSIFKSHNHDHYWIENEHLFESYMTLRGMRYRELMEVKEMEDCDNCSETMMNYIANKYLEN